MAWKVVPRALTGGVIVPDEQHALAGQHGVVDAHDFVAEDLDQLCG
jgi:hypothetical protein